MTSVLLYKIAFITPALLVVVATVLPLFRQDDWWIRIFDFPRLQITIIGLLVLVIYLLFAKPKNLLEWLVLAALGSALIFQGYKIFFYTPLAPQQVRSTNSATPDTSLSLMVANVLMENRDSRRFLAIVRDVDPDLVLTLEPDAWWEEQLRVLEGDYPYTVKVPLDNRYGMLLHSRLELVDPQIKALVKESIPSIHTQVRLVSGDLVRLHCVHPEPPSPTEADTSAKRDAELLIVGKEVKDLNQPVIVTGDLNDVAWSATTTLFQKTSGLLDPRIGRGMFNSYHAQNPLMRWPLDHIFHSQDFLLVEMARLPAFGSDHFPIFVKLSLEARGQVLQEKPEALDAAEKEQVEEKIDKVDQKEPL